MKAIRVIATQTLTNFRKPMSFSLKETFPLPQFSTVLGMIHKACDFTEYHDMKVGVQGIWNEIKSDIYTHYTFAPTIQFEEGRHQLYVTNFEGKKIGITRGIHKIELISELQLVLHIVPSEIDFNIVYESLKKPKSFLALGRHEDLLDIQDIQIVDVKKEKTGKTRMYMWKKFDKNEDCATVYKIQKQYEIVKNKRIFTRHDCVLVSKNTVLNNVFMDTDNFIVELF